jgi:predicted glycosyltransferase
MKIIIDIGHPAHVHYFRNFISVMKFRGHEFLIVARDKEVTHELLKQYNIPYFSRGKGSKGLAGKLLYILKADFIIYKLARKFKPDLFVSFASTYAAHVASLCRKPHIALDDTEHAKLEIFLYTPFTDTILSPDCFIGSLGKKQIRIKSFAEFLYLHRNYYQFNGRLPQGLNLPDKKPFVLLRFIAWTASHDVGQKGIPYEEKVLLIKELKKRGYEIRISSEGDLPEEFLPYKLQTPSNKIHDVISAASLFIGESGTMSTEACILGTPAFFVNSLDAGVFREEVQRGLLFHLKTGEGAVNYILEKIDAPDFLEKHRLAVEKLHAEKIDFTAFLINFCENYPQNRQDILVSQTSS